MKPARAKSTSTQALCVIRCCLRCRPVRWRRLAIATALAALSCTGQRVGGDAAADAGGDTRPDVHFTCGPGGPFACTRSGAILDDDCVKVGLPPQSYDCSNVWNVPSGCVNKGKDCVNCSDWCCPPDAGPGTLIESLPEAGPSDAADPPGCKRAPEDDLPCRAIGVAPRGFACTKPYPAPESGCSGNPYGAESCTVSGFLDMGRMCCP